MKANINEDAAWEVVLGCLSLLQTFKLCMSIGLYPSGKQATEEEYRLVFRQLCDRFEGAHTVEKEQLCNRLFEEWMQEDCK